MALKIKKWAEKLNSIKMIVAAIIFFISAAVTSAVAIDSRYTSMIYAVAVNLEEYKLEQSGVDVQKRIYDAEDKVAQNTKAKKDVSEAKQRLRELREMKQKIENNLLELKGSKRKG